MFSTFSIPVLWLKVIRSVCLTIDPKCPTILPLCRSRRPAPRSIRPADGGANNRHYSTCQWADNRNSSERRRSSAAGLFLYARVRNWARVESKRAKRFSILAQLLAVVVAFRFDGGDLGFSSDLLVFLRTMLLMKFYWRTFYGRNVIFLHFCWYWFGCRTNSGNGIRITKVLALHFERNMERRWFSKCCPEKKKTL